MATGTVSNGRAILFSSTLGLSAFLIFWLEPMVGKLLLPSLGGSPSVWNVCMTVYQVALLLGYIVAHLLARAEPRKQIVLQGLLFLCAALMLPIAFPPADLKAISESPHIVGSLASLLMARIGLPFIALATLSPLLQTWWARAQTPGEGKEPYFLFAASNAGSFLGLLGYPFFIERSWSLAQQRTLWMVLFFVCVALIAACALIAGKAQPAERQKESLADLLTGLDSATTAKWIGLAFIPSSLTLGATSFLTSDVASIPLLWVIPLGLYLLTFIIAFARLKASAWPDKALPACALGLLFLTLIKATEPPWLLFLAHLAFLFIAALACHQRMAALRPDPRQLTVYYLAIAVGGALGGIFNSLVAPLVFTSVLEYPIAILLACAIRVMPPARRPGPWWSSAVPAIALTGVAVIIGLSVNRVESLDTPKRALITAGIPLFAAFFLSKRPFTFAATIAGVLVAVTHVMGPDTKALFAERNFFGVSRVVHDSVIGLRTYYHGTTIHGTQSWNPNAKCDPLAYYNERGPLGDVIRVFREANSPRQVGAIGLGTGAVAAHSQSNEQWVFYEIDPVVAEIALNTNLFTYLKGCSAGEVKIVIGDGRLKIAEAPAGAFGLLILDAFSSDAIPTHLLTREALHIYLQKLAPEGMIAIHISSRHLDLGPPIAELARDAGVHAVQQEDPDGQALIGTYSSDWVVLTRSAAVARKLLASPTPDDTSVPWWEMRTTPGTRLWTDDYTDVLSTIQLR